MPLYEYRCLSCNHIFDVIQKVSDAPLTDCPECGKKVEKCMSSPAALQFKGSGFYITDYAKKKSGKTGKTSTGTDKKGKAKSGKKAG